MTLALGDDSKQEVVTSQLIELDNSPTLTTTNVDLLTISSLDTPLSPSKVSLPISVTHFSENGMAGLQRETIFSDNFLNNQSSGAANTGSSAAVNNGVSNHQEAGRGVQTVQASSAGANPSTNPFISNFVAPSAESVPQAQTENNPFNSGQKFATIGRTNPFSSPNKSKNPFLDRLDAPPAPTVPAPAPASPSPMSTGSPSNSPDASLDPTSESSDSSTSTLNKIVSNFGVLLFGFVWEHTISDTNGCRLLPNLSLFQETSFANNQPVTRSLSSVGKKPLQQSSSRLPVLGNVLISDHLNNALIIDILTDYFICSFQSCQIQFKCE